MTDETETPEYRENLACVGEALLDTIRRNCPGYAYLNCPSEIVVDLINERDELKAALAGLLECHPSPGEPGGPVAVARATIEAYS